VSYVDAWNNVFGSIQFALTDWIRDLLSLIRIAEYNDARREPIHLDAKDEADLERQQKLRWLIAELEKNPALLRSFLSMKEATYKSMHDDSCDPDWYATSAAIQIVTELVELFDIFYKCEFSLAALQKIPAGTFAPYQKLLNVFWGWFAKNLVL